MGENFLDFMLCMINIDCLVIAEETDVILGQID